MAGYLLKYKGVLRIRADYDLSTNDFIRDSDGNLEPSFDDYYIKIKKGKIRHYQGKELFFYILSTGRFRNILKQVYEDKISSTEKFINNKIFNYEKMYEELISNGIITYIDEMDGEAEAGFYDKDMEYFAKILIAETNGRDISPFSKSNLPKKKYSIPLEELTLYKDIIKDIPKNEILRIGQITKRFDSVIQAKKGKKYDINSERKLSCLKNKEFIHSIGLWKEYIDFLKKGLNE